MIRRTLKAERMSAASLFYSSNTDLCSCGPCTNGAPWQYIVNVPAVANGFCTECGLFEGTYILDLVETTTDRCRWLVAGSFPCGAQAMQLIIRKPAGSSDPGPITMEFGTVGSIVMWRAGIDDCLAENVLDAVPMSGDPCDNTVQVTVIPIVEEWSPPTDCTPVLTGCQYGSILGPMNPVPAVCPEPKTRLTPAMEEDCHTSSCSTGSCGNGSGLSGIRGTGKRSPNDSPALPNEGTGGVSCELCAPAGGALDPVAGLTYNSFYANEKRTAFGYSERHQRTITELGTSDVMLQTGAGNKHPFRQLDTATGYYVPPFGSTSKLKKTVSGWQETTEEFWVYDYDTTGRVVTMSAPGGAVWTVSYSGSSQRIISIESPVGRRLSYSYDINSNLSKITDAGGRETLVSIDSSGDLVSFTTPELCVTNLSYDASHRLTRYQDPMGYVYSYGYDSLDRLTSIEAPNGGRTTYQYATGRRVAVMNALGSIETLTFNVTGNPTSIQNPLGQITTLGWTRNRLASVQNPMGETNAYTYQEIANAGLRLQTHTQPMGQVYTFDFDSTGHLESVENPLGFTNTTTWNGSNQRTSCVDALSAVHTFAFETTGQVKSITNPIGAVVTYRFDTSANLESVENPLGNRTSFVSDVAGRAIATVDPLGNRTTSTLDDMNR